MMKQAAPDPNKDEIIKRYMREIETDPGMADNIRNAIPAARAVDFDLAHNLHLAPAPNTSPVEPVDSAAAVKQTMSAESKAIADKIAALPANIDELVAKELPPPPPGYRITAEAKAHIAALAACVNRAERRALEAHARKRPFETLEVDPDYVS